MKVYAVNSGCYSDYRINGIFSTLAGAKQFMEKCRAAEACWNKDFNDIEIYELDAELEQTTYTRYSVGIMLDDGSVAEKAEQEYFGIPESSVNVAKSVPFYKGRGIARAESHKSAAHAMKLAAEARQKWLRERP